MGKKNDELLTTREAMEFLGVDWNAIYTYIAEGKLRAHKLGGNGKSRRHWRIWYSDLVRFVNQGSRDEGEVHAESVENEVKSELLDSPSPSL